MITKIIKKIEAFLKTPYFPILVALIVLLCHSFSLDIIGFTILAVLAVLVLLVSADSIRVIPILVFGILLVSEKHSPYSATGAIYKENLTLLIILGVFLIGAFIYRWIRSGERKFKSIKLIYGLVAISIASFLGGLFYFDYNFENLLVAATFTFVTLGLFYFFITTIKWDKNSFDYICYIMTIAIVLIVCQMGILYFITKPQLLKTFSKGGILLGWGISNSIAATLTVMLPFVLYQMSVKDKKYAIIYFIIATIGVLAVIYTLSRTSLLFCGLCYIAVAVYNIIWGKNKRLFWILYGAIALILIVLFIFLREQILHSLHFFIEKGIDDSGRSPIYKIGLTNWKNNPIFGTGYKYASPKVDPILNFWFLIYHNHIIQFLASTGIIGLAAYLFHRVETLILIFKKPTTKKIFMFLSILMFVGTSFFDVTFFNPAALIIYSILLVTLVKDKQVE